MSTSLLLIMRAYFHIFYIFHKCSRQNRADVNRAAACYHYQQGNDKLKLHLDLALSPSPSRTLYSFSHLLCDFSLVTQHKLSYSLSAKMLS